MFNKNAYCKGLLCRETDRKFKSCASKKMMCGKCSIDLGNNKYCSVDEFIISDHPLIEKEYKLFIKSNLEQMKTTNKNVLITK